MLSGNMDGPVGRRAGDTWSSEVVLIEDDEDVRGILRLLFELDDRFRLVGEAGDGLTGIDVVRATQPSVVVLDMQLPGATGAEVIAATRARSPRTRIVVFSAFPDPFTLVEVLRLGADSYLDKATAWLDLIPTIVELCGLPERASTE
jgi:DNA-binding NarL/FixJ family response regulator